MTTHIFGMILTHQGTFSNNRGEGEGTTNTLQKVIRGGGPLFDGIGRSDSLCSA